MPAKHLVKPLQSQQLQEGVIQGSTYADATRLARIYTETSTDH